MRAFESVLIVVTFILGLVVGIGVGKDIGVPKGKAQLRAEQKAIFYSTLVSQITYCESRGFNDRVGKLGEKGVAQFKKKTFNWMKALANRPDLKWLDAEDQKWLLEWAVRNGYGNHWKTCYNRALPKAVYITLQL
jgi:hypothetical protein